MGGPVTDGPLPPGQPGENPQDWKMDAETEPKVGHTSQSSKRFVEDVSGAVQQQFDSAKPKGEHCDQSPTNKSAAAAETKLVEALFLLLLHFCLWDFDRNVRL